MTPERPPCPHPGEAVYYNPGNRVVQCHACGWLFVPLADPVPAHIYALAVAAEQAARAPSWTRPRLVPLEGD